MFIIEPLETEFVKGDTLCYLFYAPGDGIDLKTRNSPMDYSVCKILFTEKQSKAEIYIDDIHISRDDINKGYGSAAFVP